MNTGVWIFFMVIAVSIAFGAGAVWASAIGLVRSFQDESTADNHDDLVENIVSSNGHARTYSDDPYDLSDGWPPGEVR